MDLIYKYNVGFKTLLQQGIPGSVFPGHTHLLFHGDLVDKFKIIVGKQSFPDQFKNI